MAAEDMRDVITFYGYETDHWNFTFGPFANHTKLLEREYLSEACSCTQTSEASLSNKFIYQHHIKKTYFIEGVISGHVTFASSGATSYITSYRVTVCKVNENTHIEDELFSTNWKTIDETLDWNSTYSYGDEIVFPFWIDAWNKEEIGEYDRIYVKVEANCDNNCVLWHDNNQTYEDLKINIPFIL